jgi:penicillin V acylase-like amidase (Ntn superfamily)
MGDGESISVIAGQRGAHVSRRCIFTLASLGIAVLAPTPVLPCTTVCLLEKDKAVVAYNYDFYPPEGLVLVNKRGTRKVSSLRTQGAAWAATYGSVTFNQFGRDNPMTGINEKGLMVSQMWLDETKYPPADTRPVIGILEWIQYNLDRHASVSEVLANAETVRPASRAASIHYLVTDATGDAAVVEFLDGKLAVHRGGAMPVRALANSTYADSVAAFERARSKGEVPTSTSSLDRFVRAAMLAGGGNADPIARGFEILASVAQPSFTRWSIVYDLSAREVYFTTEGNRAIRRFALAGFDFSCGTPVKMLDVTAGGAGDVGFAFVDYSAAANRALIESAFAKTPFLREVPASARDTFAAHPEATSSCGAANGALNR